LVSYLSHAVSLLTTSRRPSALSAASI
jgi:hypothetical protein